MNCFIFDESRKTHSYNEICGSTPLNDLIVHLRSSGVTRIFSDTSEGLQGVEQCSFESAKSELGSGWVAAFGGNITRQSPMELRNLTVASGADSGVSLACSSKPWEHTTVLTDGSGLVENTENNPSPENLETNLCFSGLVWVATNKFNPGCPLSGKTAAFLLPGYWRRPDSRENYLLTVHDVLSGEVLPWPHLTIPKNGVILNSSVPEGTEIRGTLWVGKNCRIGSDCKLENCVLLKNSTTGANSNLRNCLVSSAAEIPPGTVQYDKYLSFFTGDDYGREY